MSDIENIRWRVHRILNVALEEDNVHGFIATLASALCTLIHTRIPAIARISVVQRVADGVLDPRGVVPKPDPPLDLSGAAESIFTLLNQMTVDEALMVFTSALWMLVYENIDEGDRRTTIDNIVKALNNPNAKIDRNLN